MRLLVILIFIAIFIQIANSAPKMDTTRQLFYDAVNDEDKLELAIKEFDNIMKKEPAKQGVATTYIGSLTMLKGKHAFWPHKQVEFVNEGIKVMDRGLEFEPDNLESLFIYGSTCYYLPFFLGKGSLAKEKLKKMVSLLSKERINQYDAKIMVNALNFIIEKIELSKEEMEKAEYFLKILKP